jgi:hypothetical protein
MLQITPDINEKRVVRIKMLFVLLDPGVGCEIRDEKKNQSQDPG